jgi:hypothetical protein
MFVFGYIGCAIFGAIAGGIAAAAADVREDDLMLYAIAGYLVGIAMAISISYLVVCSMAPIPKRRRAAPDDDYDDYDDRRDRRHADDEDDDYDRRRTRRRREDDDYDRPRRSRRDDDF